MMRFGGKVVLVTGGTAGIGAAAVRRFAAEGAHVVFTGSNAAAAAQLCADIGTATGPAPIFHVHRVQDAAGWQGVEALIRARCGRLDVAFANAGIEGGDSSIETIELDAWDQIVAVNLTGAMLTARAAIRLMRDNPGGPSGAIILNSSMNGILALGGNVGYSTTKGALRLLAKSVAVHCASQRLPIRCTSIHPGVVETALIGAAIASAPDPAVARGILEGIAPMKRMGTVEEIAALVAFLASDEASFITGAEYSIDGGSTAGMQGV